MILEMEMVQQPNRSDQKSNYQHEKQNATLASLFPQRAATSARTGFALPPVLQRHGNVEPAAALAGAQKKFFALTFFDFFRHARRVIDHSLQLVHLFAQLGFLPRQVLFRLIERGVRSKRAAKHAASPAR